ncbi:MAG: DUF4373 domain-containing protein [Fibrobacter sp.]|nr:DUF4373 domain-containing protein [Fibrobacter sp.]
MARPIKTGLSYFPLDTVMDDNVEALEAEHGNSGFAWLIKFWQSAYRTENGEIVFRAEYSRKILAKRADITLEKQDSIIHTCLEVGLLDAEAYKNGILTSSGIRKRLEKVNKIRASERERKGNSFPAGKPLENNRKTSGKGGKVKVKEKEKNKTFHPLSELLRTKIQEQGTDALFKESDLDNWSNEFRLMVEQDKRTFEQIREKIEAVFKNDFWKKQIRSASTFREKWNSGKLDNLKTNKPEENPEPIKPVIEQNPWAKIRREAQQEAANATE